MTDIGLARSLSPLPDAEEEPALSEVEWVGKNGTRPCNLPLLA